MAFKIVYAAAFINTLLHSVMRTIPAARRAESISLLQELVSLGKRRKDLTQAILSLQELANIKLCGYLREDLSVDPDDFHKGLSSTQNVAGKPRF